jgi:hypothetical protein
MPAYFSWRRRAESLTILRKGLQVSLGRFNGVSSSSFSQDSELRPHSTYGTGHFCYKKHLGIILNYEGVRKS